MLVIVVLIIVCVGCFTSSASAPQGFPTHLSPGDLVFSRGNEFLDLVSGVTSHVCIVIDDDTVLECGINGVCIRNVDSITPKTFYVRRAKVKIKKDDIIRVSKNFIGVPISDDIISVWLFGGKRGSYLHCSEFIAIILSELGLTRDIIFPWLLSPQDLLFSKDIPYERPTIK